MLLHVFIHFPEETELWHSVQQRLQGTSKAYLSLQESAEGKSGLWEWERFHHNPHCSAITGGFFAKLGVKLQSNPITHPPDPVSVLPQWLQEPSRFLQQQQQLELHSISSCYTVRSFFPSQFIWLPLHSSFTDPACLLKDPDRKGSVVSGLNLQAALINPHPGERLSPPLLLGAADQISTMDSCQPTLQKPQAQVKEKMPMTVSFAE